MKKISLVLIICTMTAYLLTACTQQTSAPTISPKKLSIVTTLFPLYDFARTIGGDKAEVALLLPPGVEAHSYQPKPDDAVRVSRADIFVYTNRYMEPWGVSFAQNIGSKRLTLVDSSIGVTFLQGGEEEAGGDKHDQHGSGMDPHIWLDFEKAIIMTRNIANAMIAKDPANRNYYAANEATLVARLQQLDGEFKKELSTCRNKTFLHGGHYTFGYLAHRYGLLYQSAAAVNADAEPTPATIIGLVKKVRELGLTHVFSEEMLSPRVAEMIARETGVSVLLLHGAHNISRQDLSKGVTFVELMNRNRENLVTGLGCR